MKIEIMILNYNGRDLLQKCLPSIVEASKNSIYKPHIIVVDNKSTDDSRNYVGNNFRDVIFKEMPENRVLCSLNDAARESDADIIIFLNNDLVVSKDFIDPMIDIFIQKKGVFLSAARVYNFDGTDIEEGRTKPSIRWGIVKGVSRYKGYENDLENESYTFLAGFGAFDRKKFLELGGYDALYLPGIMEDTDICFRAWRRGYYCYYQPKSHIYHIGRASFAKRFGNSKLLAISHRNTYFFIWKNITDARILAMNLLFTLPRMIYALAAFKFEIIQGFVWFLRELPGVLKSRKKEYDFSGIFNVRTDREVFGIFK